MPIALTFFVHPGKDERQQQSGPTIAVAKERGTECVWGGAEAERLKEAPNASWISAITRIHIKKYYF